MAQETVAVGADHAGYLLKTALAKKLRHMGFDVIDVGTGSDESVDYPDYAERVVTAMSDGQAQRGLLVCGSGIGMSIAANRHAGIRAALCCNAEMAKLSRQHNDANVLVLGERLIGEEEAKNCVEAFFSTAFEGGRHQRRVAKLG